MNAKGPLGRGIEALIPAARPVIQGEAAGQAEGSVLEIDIALIDKNRYQPRENFDADYIAALAESIKENGLLQPPTVYKEGGRFTLIFGECRFRAAALAGLKRISCTVAEKPSDKEMLELALIENTLRDDLKPLELANTYARLRSDFSYTQEEIARVVGRERSTIANTLRLLELPVFVKEALKARQITEGHARQFMREGMDEAKARTLLEEIIAKKLSVRETEDLAKKLASGKTEPAPREKSPDALLFERELTDFTGLSVTLKEKKTGGVLEFKYRNLEELDTFMEKIGARTAS